IVSEHLVCINPIVSGAAKISAVDEHRPARRERAPTVSHCPGAALGERTCPQLWQRPLGLRSRSGPAHSLGFSAPAATESRAISPVAPPSQAFASSTTAHCATSASCGPRSKRRSTVSSLLAALVPALLPALGGCDDPHGADGCHDPGRLCRRIPDLLHEGR